MGFFFLNAIEAPHRTSLWRLPLFDTGEKSTHISTADSECQEKGWFKALSVKKKAGSRRSLLLSLEAIINNVVMTARLRSK